MLGLARRRQALSWTYVLIIDLYRHNKIASPATATTTQHPLTMFWQMFSTRTTKAFPRLKSQTRASRFAFSNKTFFSVFAFWILDEVFFSYCLISFFSRLWPEALRRYSNGAIETKSCTKERESEREHAEAHNRREILCKAWSRA